MVIVLLLIMGLLGHNINNNVYRYFIYANLIISGVEVLGKLDFKTYLTKLVSLLQFTSLGFSWVLLAIIVGTIAYLHLVKLIHL